MARIVVDWGSSNFRAYLFDSDGAVKRRHEANAGILNVKDGAFEDALIREIGEWIVPDTEIFLSGMITSRNGWVETPYIDVPAGLHAVAAGAVSQQLACGADLRFLPGVCMRAPVSDVMRGEEIQVFGSVEAGENAAIVLPGTHSKWVLVRGGKIVDFRTFLTGESFALLSHHSLIGKLIPDDNRPSDEGIFREGVRQAIRSSSMGVLNDVFTLRASVLLGHFTASEITDRLSGILIGHELKAAARFFEGVETPPLLVGDTALTARYALAFSELGKGVTFGPADAAIEGFRRLAAMDS